MKTPRNEHSASPRCTHDSRTDAKTAQAFRSLCAVSLYVNLLKYYSRWSLDFDIMIDMKDSWKNNPDFDQNKIELVPVDWIWKYRGENPSKLIALENGDVDLDGLWEDIEINGLLVPLIIRVGTKNKKFRLEAGNHVIQLFKKHNITEVPVTVQLRNICGPEAVDVMTEATHNFDWGDEVSMPAITTEYMKPSEIFPSLGNLIYNTNMYFKSKKTSLIILGITSLALSRTMFVFFNDPEGPNLLVVIVMAAILYFLSLAVYLYYSRTKPIGLKRLLLAILIQIIIATIFYFCLN